MVYSVRFVSLIFMQYVLTYRNNDNDDNKKKVSCKLYMIFVLTPRHKLAHTSPYTFPVCVCRLVSGGVGVCRCEWVKMNVPKIGNSLIYPFKLLQIQFDMINDIFCFFFSAFLVK